jgi:hypothetical protein
MPSNVHRFTFETGSRVEKLVRRAWDELLWSRSAHRGAWRTPRSLSAGVAAEAGKWKVRLAVHRGDEWRFASTRWMRWYETHLLYVNSQSLKAWADVASFAHRDECRNRTETSLHCYGGYRGCWSPPPFPILYAVCRSIPQVCSDRPTIY